MHINFNALMFNALFYIVFIYIVPNFKDAHFTCNNYFILYTLINSQNVKYLSMITLLGRKLIPNVLILLYLIII